MMFQHVFKNEEEKVAGIKDVLIRVEEMQVVVYVNPGANLGILREALRRIKNLVIAPELGGKADAIIKFKRGEARVLIMCNPIYFGFDLSKVNLVFYFHLSVDDKGVIDFQKYYRVATWGGSSAFASRYFYAVDFIGGLVKMLSFAVMPLLMVGLRCLAVTSNWAVCYTLNPPVLPPIPPEGVKVSGGTQT
ncbi:zinc finger, CCHC-type containing protein [Tanacetum coccineum]